MAHNQGNWEGGSEQREINEAKERIKDEREKIEKLRKDLKRSARGASNGSTPVTVPAAASVDAVDDDDDLRWEGLQTCNHRVLFLTREETLLAQREQRLQVERQLHLKLVQRLEAGERSNFGHYPLLNNKHKQEQYQLLDLIGKGGFSEVYRAFDLENNRQVAVKIHELGQEMTDQQRQSYIRRAMRENEIQQELKHPRVLALLDMFPISPKAFGTVLELSEGITLDEYMKRQGALPEKEAKSLVIQILSGLKYMNSFGRKIIHYDLKPGNLFHYYGEIKIADFGLSKVVNEEIGHSIELTSQGAGTYWYLPPECFTNHNEPARISNKVDVWSTGVIFYELLFAKRPFGHGQSQQALLRAATAGQAFSLELPPAKEFLRVPDEAKEFLKRLLTISRDDRPDVFQAFADPYLRPKQFKSSAPGTVSSNTDATI